MKAQAIIITLLFSLLALNGFASSTDPEKQEQKKPTQEKYDFNIFKLFTVSHSVSVKDSVKVTPTIVTAKRKED